MTRNNGGAEGARPLIIATILREEGTTGVQTHVRQLRRYLRDCGTETEGTETDGTGPEGTGPEGTGPEGTEAELVTPFSWGGPVTKGVFGLRLALQRVSQPASVVWYRYWHEVFLRQALRRRLAAAGDCVVYAQCPLSARAALRARRGPHQRVVMAVHFRISQADEWADKGEISHDGAVFRGIRRLERQVIPRADGLVYVSRWARNALLQWLPQAAAVPDAVIDNFVTPYTPHQAETVVEPVGDLVTTGGLEPVKNHRFLLEVLARARQAGHSLTLDMFGEGPLRPELERQARELGLAGQVRFRGFRRDLRDFLPGYRAYVHASYSESSSLAIIEAMAAGLPIVAGNIGPIAELCDDGAEARFWPLDDPDRAAAILVRLLDSEPDRLAAASAATARFHRDFDADLIAPRLRSFLMETAPPASEEVLVRR